MLILALAAALAATEPQPRLIVPKPPTAAPSEAAAARAAIACPAGKVIQADPVRRGAEPARLRPLAQEPDAHMVRAILRDRCNSDDVLKYDVSKK